MVLCFSGDPIASHHFPSLFQTKPLICSRLPKPPPELPLEVWFEIFEFATFVSVQENHSPEDAFASKPLSRSISATNTPSMATKTKLSLMLVSHGWRQVAVRLLYRQIAVTSPVRANKILNTLLQSMAYTEGSGALGSGYGQWTRHLEVFTHARGSRSINYLKTLFRIFQCCPRLQKLSGVWNYQLPIQFITSVSELYGPSLYGLSWAEQQDRLPIEPDNTFVSLSFFSAFQSLTLLDLRFFRGPSTITSITEKARSFRLPQVKDLILSSCPSSIITATCLQLPALCNLTLRPSSSSLLSDNLIKDFLKVHGSRLQAIDIWSPALDTEPEPDSSDVRRQAPHIAPQLFIQDKLCPNLTTFLFPITSPCLGDVNHTNLRRIGLRGIHGLFPDKSPQTRDQLMAINLERFPNLESVKAIGFVVDSLSDPINKDVFIWWMERFEKLGIDFLDGEGVIWVYEDDPSSTANSSKSGTMSVTESNKIASGTEQVNDVKEV